MDPTFPLVSIINFLLAIIVLLLLPYRFNDWSIAIRVYIIWLALMCTCRGINSIIWKDNTDDVAPVWCDITTRIFTGGSVAIPACSFSIIYRLYRTTCTNKLATTRAEKRWEVVTDLSLSLVFPLVVIALSHVVQGNRYDIYEEIGCTSYHVNTALLYVLVLMWPLVFGTMSAIFAALVVRTFITQHKELNEALTNESSKVTYSRFYRAFALASVDTLFTIPFTIVVIYIDAVITGPVIPWPGWSAVHAGFSKVYTVPAIYWRDPRLYRLAPHGIGWYKFSMAWHQWVYAFCTFIFIAIYGTTGEVARYYKSAFRRIAGFFGVKWNQESGPAKKERGMPSTIVFESVVAPRAGTTFDSPSMMQSSTSGLSLEIPVESSQAGDAKTSPIEVRATHEDYTHTKKESVGELKMSVDDSKV